MAEITTTQTMGNKTITTTINTGARGPVGPAGTPGSDADVTAANVQAAGAQMTTIGFLDRFDDSSRYAENAELVNNVSLPEIGSVAYHQAAATSPFPKIVSGALEPTGNSLCYIHNQVTTTGGKFSLGLVVDFKRASNYSTAVNNGGFTIAISDVEIIPSAGDTGQITASEPLHITIRPDGISDASVYPAIATLTCLNATVAAGVYPWTARQTQLPFGEKLTIILRIEGDILEIEAVGVGSLYFTHPLISSKVAATTYFFYEPVGPTNGTGYKQTARLYRWWASADELDQTTGYGIVVPEVSGGPHRFPGQLQLYPNGQTSSQSGNTLAGQSTAAIRGGSVGTSTKGSYNRATGGHVQFEGMVSHEYGLLNTGASFQGFMVGAPDTNLNATVSSTAGAATSPNIGLNYFNYGMENGDWETIFLAGQLVGANNKRLLFTADVSPFSSPTTLLDSGTITTAGFWTAEIRRYTGTGGMILYSKLEINGALIDARRVVESGVNVQTYFGVSTTTVDAGGVTVDTHMRQVARVNPL